MTCSKQSYSLPTKLAREVGHAGIETQEALDILRDTPDKVEAAVTCGPDALVVYRLDPNGARGIVSNKDAKLRRFVAAAEQDNAPLFGFCPAVVAEFAAHINMGVASLRNDA
ncbi:hypothetical protein J7394_09905 [Ruegeria sp. R13_0]|uniref:hypothetical protein n=1 Tax=Ruegeria sp. R13_0 TaxID=2821099 RepID=UPI001ADAF8D3|nr:hypothetical protein [Ruegeria sp. R13_0]MBO9434519.1 hypothetical protein [Ruegeria sp. R13_0]